MSPNKQKIKGTYWENEFVDLINENVGDAIAKRIAGSGMIGTILEEPLLTGDVIIKFSGFPRKFRVECKTGYGGSKQLTLQKEWFTKIIKEAKQSYDYPLLAFKFLGARESGGVQYFVALDFDTFVEIINYIDDLKKELDLHYKG